jgi:MraZ protein
MSQFWGTHHNKRDSKGRVSIPAAFRAALKGKTDSDPIVSVVLRASHKYSCIDAWPVSEFERLSIPLQRLDFFSDDQEDLATTIYADAFPVESDKEGRIVVPESLVRHAALEDMVTFVGLGQIFQIWEPGAAERRRVEARERTRTRQLTLSTARAATPSAEGAT